jgi:hypothetical protein
MNRVFLTFGDGRTGWKAAAKRLTQEAHACGHFSELYNFNFRSLAEINLESSRVVDYLRHSGHYRGFGYWVWKPALLRWAHLNFPNSNIVYIDSGSHIIRGHRDPTLAEILDSSEKSGGLAWHLPLHNDIQWTKKELISFLKPSETDLASDQVQSGFISLPPSGARAELTERWFEISILRNGFYFTDEEYLVQDESFIEHRHDQSALSLLWKWLKLPSQTDCTFPSKDNFSALISSRNNTSMPYKSSQHLIQSRRYLDLSIDFATRRK